MRSIRVPGEWLPAVAEVRWLVPTALATALALVMFAFVLRLRSTGRLRAGRAKAPNRWERRLTVAAAVPALVLSAEGMWEVTQTLRLALPVAATTFFTAELMMVKSASTALRLRRSGMYAGRHVKAVFVIAAVSGVIASANGETLVERLLRLAIPIGVAGMWWTDLGADDETPQAPERSTWRWTPKRLLVRIGALKPGVQGLDEAERKWRITAMTRAAYRRDMAVFGGLYQRRLRRLLLAADDAQADQTVQNLDRVTRFELMLTRQVKRADASGEAESGATLHPLQGEAGVKQSVSSDPPRVEAARWQQVHGGSDREVAERFGVSAATVLRGRKDLERSDAQPSVNGRPAAAGLKENK